MSRTHHAIGCLPCYGWLCVCEVKSVVHAVLTANAMPQTHMVLKPASDARMQRCPETVVNQHIACFGAVVLHTAFAHSLDCTATAEYEPRIQTAHSAASVAGEHWTALALTSIDNA